MGQFTDIEVRMAKEVAENHRRRPRIIDRGAFKYLFCRLSNKALKFIAPKWEATLI